MARTYHVLKLGGEGTEADHYLWLGTLEASSGEQAIRLAAVENGTGRYVSVPDGNWTSIGVRVEIPAPRVIFETEEAVAAAAVQGYTSTGTPVRTPTDEIVDPADDDGVTPAPIDDEEYLERKAELAARRAGQ